MIQVRVAGQARLGASLRRLQAAQAVAVADAVTAGARDIQAAARERLPRRSGRLARSVSVEITPDGLAATIGTELAHGTYLELGTRRMAARPWLQPALLAVRSSVRARFARMANAALALGRGLP
jgi:HK97 gp10 family phage protein